jgi:hypothetical protein
MTTPISSPKTPPPLKLDRVSGGVYPRSPNVSVNKNVEWINSRGAWTFYIALILLNWMVLSTVMNPGESKLSHLHFSVLTIGACKAQRYTGGGLMQDLRCCAGTSFPYVLLYATGLAWTYVHLIHGVLTYYLLHWHKGSPIDMDQGKYDKLTFWEQLDDGVQNTTNRKFFTAVPVVLFLLAAHGSDYRRQPLGVNLAVVLVLVIAKFSGMHKVRLFGIGEVKYNA